MTNEPNPARRPVWKASLIGAAIAALFTTLPVILLILWMSVPSGYAGAAMGAALLVLVLGALAIPLLGALAGGFLLRRRQSLLYALWVIPCTLAVPALIAYGAYAGYAVL